MSSEAKFVHPQKAQPPMDVTVLGMSIWVRLLQFLNACVGITFILLGIEIDSRLLQS